MTGRIIIGGTVALLGLIAAAAVYLLVFAGPTERVPGSVNVEGAEIGGPFTLTAPDGSRVTDADVIDRPTFVYFGYTFCPDICPVDTVNMADAVDMLAEQGIDAKAVFITVDPERDTPDVMGDYASALSPKMLGLSGSAEDIRAAADAYRAYFQKVEVPDSDYGYLMNHTGYIYLMLPEKGIAALFEHGTLPEHMAQEAERVID